MTKQYTATMVQLQEFKTACVTLVFLTNLEVDFQEILVPVFLFFGIFYKIVMQYFKEKTYSTCVMTGIVS